MDQILISSENMILNIENLYDVVILDFLVIFCLSVPYTVPFFVSVQTYQISKGSNNYCSHCIHTHFTAIYTLSSEHSIHFSANSRDPRRSAVSEILKPPCLVPTIMPWSKTLRSYFFPISNNQSGLNSLRYGIHTNVVFHITGVL